MGIIQYELNEIPWRVVDDFVSKNPSSALSQILQEGHNLTTFTKDEGELHPWSTWPTVHRGVFNTTHKIAFLNQALPSDYPPIWDILKKGGLSVGVFGSLQSYPPESGYAFYIPDTFSPSADTFPKIFEHFQSFNLAQTQKDGAIAKPLKINVSFVKSILKLLQTGLSLKTFTRLGLHFIKEQINADHKTYRSILQAPVAFDFFLKTFKETKPQFATFFTNHLAGMMHRYWKYTFPEDFDFALTTKRDYFLSQNIDKALKIADEQISILKNICDTMGYNLAIVSSMGQEKIDRGAYVGEFRISNFKQFYQGIGYGGVVDNHLAMQPDFAFAFESPSGMQSFKEKALRLTNEHGDPLFKVKESNETLNLNLIASAHCLQNDVVYVDGNPVPSATFGFEIIHRDEGTGYHQPFGIAIFYGKNIQPSHKRHIVESIQITPTILKYFGVDRPKYMAPPINELFKNN